MPFEIPYLGDMADIPRFERFANLMAWYYEGWDSAQKHWREILAAKFNGPRWGLPEERIFSATVAELTVRLEMNFKLQWTYSRHH
jgi:hypothetical protein